MTTTIPMNRFLTENAFASLRPYGASAPRYGSAKDVRVLPVVIPELRFCDIERQILSRHLVVAAHDRSLQQRPETINCLSVNCTRDVLTFAVADPSVRVVDAKALIPAVLIGREQTDAGGDGFANKALHGLRVGVADDARNDRAATGYGAHDDFLAHAASAGDFLIPMPVFVLAADIGLIDLHDAHQAPKLGIDQSSPDAVAHEMRGLIRAEAHHAVDLKRADTFFADQHQIDDLEPLAQADVAVGEDRADSDGKAVTALIASTAKPIEWTSLQFPHPVVPAAGAPDYAIGPAPGLQIRLAGIVSREQHIELFGGHLAGEGGHRSAPHV